MKYKIIFLTLFSFFIHSLWAQETFTSSHQLNWKGVEKWSVNSFSVKVISFVDAHYPSENRLPNFSKQIPCDPSFSYRAEVKNQVFIPLTNEENAVIAGNLIPTQPKVTITQLIQRREHYLGLCVFPFIIREGKFFKLASFDLVVSKTPKAQKAVSKPLHSFAATSVLAQGKFVKIKVANDGIYKLTNDDLKSMGVDPANVRIFGYGGGVLEQSFLQPKNDDLPEVAIWKGGDYILFYAQGINRWSFDKSSGMFTHCGNSYSKYGYYFVSSDAGVGKKISEKAFVPAPSGPIVDVDQFDDYKVHENDLVNLASSGKEFYGETFSDVVSFNLNSTIPNVVPNAITKVRLDLAASSSLDSRFTITLNGGQAKTLPVSGTTSGDEQGRGNSAIFTFSPQSNSLNFNLAYTKSTSVSVGYLNYLELNVRRYLKMDGVAMAFQNADYLSGDFMGETPSSRFQLSDASANVQIWDLTDPVNIYKVSTTPLNGKMTFIASNDVERHYLAIDPTAASAFPKPEIVGVVPNQNLHGITQADMVIISHPSFLTQAETLAQAHRQKDHLTVSVVSTEQVYNEFSSGTPDATAYRWVMKMLYDRAASNKTELPKYLLLFGRGSYDNRKILSNSGDNLILTYQAENSLVTTLSYVTDDYFALLDDHEGAQVAADLLDIGVGRFPVTTAQQATDVVNKTISYMNNQEKGNWKNQLCFLADDGDGALHMEQSDSIASFIARTNKAYQMNKIYLDAYLQEVTASGERYPLAKSRFQNLLRSGLFLLDYTGHAGATGWGNESILSIGDVKVLTNKNLPVWVGATCDFLDFDKQTVSAGEHVLLNPNGGGIGILSAARPVYASQNFILNKSFCNKLFKKLNGQHQRVGDVLAAAKNSVGTETNKLSYVYMGDPALMLTYPDKYKVITSKVNESTTFGNDTLRALSVATIQGFIADENGNKVTDFNGTLHAVVYDKLQSITTMDNHHDGSLTYSDRPNALFSGSASVKAGVFSFSFMLPKDIKYNYGSGRINYYAQDEINDSEAQGYFESFLVGGANKTVADEMDGPAVQLYMNPSDPSALDQAAVFVSSTKVNETPLFVAKVSDKNGINTVGSGIGHDLMLTIDHDPTQSYILNENFISATNSYTDGVVKYKLPFMANGKHSLTFRSWDLLNNSSTSTIDFEVEKGLKPVIFSVYNYPNPAKAQTRFIVKHDRPETILSTTVEIIDLSGRLIWTFSQSSADNIVWDIVTNEGRKVKPGIYLYRVSIKTVDSSMTSKTNKMIIVEQ